MKYTVPYFSLKRQFSHLKKNLRPHIDTLFESCQFIGGPHVAEFEKQFANYVGASHAVSCNSGTDALWLALKALYIEPNSIVITTPFSFIASSSEIVAHQAFPLFVDIDGSYNICPKKIETWLKSNAIIRNNQTFYKKLNLKISGIISVDLFGQCANYDALKKIADEWNLWIIEDACQAVGAHINKRMAGTLGDISCFSLYPTKNLGVCGDGGILTTDDPELAKSLFRLRNHGRKSHYNYEHCGINSRLDSIQAIVATEKLRILDSLNKRRREIAHTYTKRFSHIPFIKTPKEDGYHVYHHYCIELDKSINRADFRSYLEQKNVGTNVYYPKALNEIPFLTPSKDLLFECPQTKKATETILSLPVWPELTDEEVDYVCTCIENAPWEDFKNVVPANLPLETLKISQESGVL